MLARRLCPAISEYSSYETKNNMRWRVAASSRTKGSLSRESWEINARRFFQSRRLLLSVVTISNDELNVLSSRRGAEFTAFFE